MGVKIQIAGYNCTGTESCLFICYCFFVKKDMIGKNIRKKFRICFLWNHVMSSNVIAKMVGPKKQDFWPKIYKLKGNHCIL